MLYENHYIHLPSSSSNSSSLLFLQPVSTSTSSPSLDYSSNDTSEEIFLQFLSTISFNKLNERIETLHNQPPSFLSSLFSNMLSKTIDESSETIVSSQPSSLNLSYDTSLKLYEDIGYMTTLITKINTTKLENNNKHLVLFCNENILLKEIKLDPLLLSYNYIILNDFYSLSLSYHLIIILLKQIVIKRKERMKLNPQQQQLKLIIYTNQIEFNYITQYFSSKKTPNGLKFSNLNLFNHYTLNNNELNNFYNINSEKKSNDLTSLINIEEFFLSKNTSNYLQKVENIIKTLNTRDINKNDILIFIPNSNDSNQIINNLTKYYDDLYFAELNQENSLNTNKRNYGNRNISLVNKNNELVYSSFQTNNFNFLKQLKVLKSIHKESKNNKNDRKRTIIFINQLDNYIINHFLYYYNIKYIINVGKKNSYYYHFNMNIDLKLLSYISKDDKFFLYHYFNFSNLLNNYYNDHIDDSMITEDENEKIYYNYYNNLSSTVDSLSSTSIGENNKNNKQLYVDSSGLLYNEIIESTYTSNISNSYYIYNLFTEDFYTNNLSNHSVSNIEKLNLSSFLLLLLSYGYNNFFQFDYYTIPKIKCLSHSLEHLFNYNILNLDGQFNLTIIKNQNNPSNLNTPTTINYSILLSELLLILPYNLSLFLINSLKFNCLEDGLILCSMLQIQWPFLFNSNQFEKEYNEYQSSRVKLTSNEIYKILKKFITYEDSDHSLLLNCYYSFILSCYSKEWCYEHYLSYNLLMKAKKMKNFLFNIIKKFCYKHNMMFESKFNFIIIFY